MKDFEIQFSGLQLGLHEFEFEMNTSFFEYFQEKDRDIQSISQADLMAHVDFEKRENMLVFEFSISGNVTLPCDRCTSDMEIELSADRRIVGRFSDEETWHDDEIIHIPLSAYKYDVSELLFEFVMLAIPSKNVHNESDCDPEMLQKIEEYLVENKDSSSEDNDDIDPRWAKLKNLK
jgi:uncharacterized metal-binding protein YceD (DUF177 family)